MDAGELMPAQALAELAEEIERVVRATPGVRALYRSGSLISNLLRIGAAALGVRKEEEPLVSIAPIGDGVAVEVSIGVEADAASGVALRAARDEIDALLAARAVRRESLTLTVVHVQPPITP